MKINDGNWLIHKGLQLISPVHIHRVDVAERAFTVLAAPRDVVSRAHQLDTPLLTLRFDSPAPGIIGVRMAHFEGVRDRGPVFALNRRSDHEVSVVSTEKYVSLTTEGLTVRVALVGEWRIDFIRSGRRITGNGLRSGGHVTVESDGSTRMFERLDLGVGENVYGLGERFTALVRNGQSVEIWNRDGGTSSEQSYKNVPFYLSSTGYGVFVNHPGQVEFEVGSEKVTKVQFSVPGESMEYFVIDGPTSKDVLNRYTGLTGKSALPPAWSFGLWLTTSFTTDYDEDTVTSFIEGMRSRALPLHVFHFDCFWMRAFQWCDFQWNPDTFPDPQGMLARLKSRGLKICVWINPYIAQASPLFSDAKSKGFLLRRPNGNVWQWDRWQPGQGIVDFTNPKACEWYRGHLESLMDMGVDCFKTDFGERIPTDVVYYDGADPYGMHNYYPQLYNKLVFEVMQEKKGQREAVVFARSATAGGQQYPVHWGGDSNSTYESMAESLRGGLSLGLSGFGFWSHDIGGFENTARADVYKRWCAFGLLSSHSRLHGSRSYRVPWLFDEEAVDVLRHFTEWKCRLMPYLFHAAVQACETGVPVMRAMILDFPADPACQFLDRQYMLGDSILVAPVFDESGTVDFYLPRGQWTHLFSAEEKAGGSWRNEVYDFKSLPLYVKSNTLLAIGCNSERPDYDYRAESDFHLFALEDGANAVSQMNGLNGEAVATVACRREGARLHINWDGVGLGCGVFLRNLFAVGANAEVPTTLTSYGVRLELPAASGSYSVHVPAWDLT